ncbi:MAG TPA: alpha/beta hydrolase [Candidatus Limnocylindrales bacterium]|nr:alpha/beta hydrolase [Candidatus Limnocylindrales bacterium]
MATVTTHESAYAAAAMRLYPIEDATIAVREQGTGPALVFIHGYPTHGYTWRHLLPRLSQSHRCVVVDLPGLGDSRWTGSTDFRFTAQARRLCRLFETLGLERYSILAHDTGATIARVVALSHGERVARLALINTEIPGHRPPFIQLYQRIAAMPGASLTFAMPMRLKAFRKSPMGFGEFYSDPVLFDDPDNLGPYVDPLLQSRARVEGALAYLRGIEWDVVDGLREKHAQIRARTMLIWGEDDKTFPVELGEQMAAQFRPPARFVRIPNASLMPHEERPSMVLDAVVPFLGEAETTS